MATAAIATATTNAPAARTRPFRDPLRGIARCYETRAEPWLHTSWMRSVRLVAHTHWDREWYLPFEEFRDKLVPTLDLVLELVEEVEGWTHFHLDGQTAMVDDYLDVRPEREADIRRHITSGALSIGPWVTLADEFLVSGESIVRNLEDGIARSRELGGDPAVAYLPDQFGHIGQMPQILALSGLADAIVWRGAPSQVTASRFAWTSPDGSSAKTFYLACSYGQGRNIESSGAGFAERIESEVARLDGFLMPEESALIPIGDDHEPPWRDLPRAIARAVSAGMDIELTSYAEHIRALEPPSLTVHGELRSAARANLLPNTYSVRPRQKIERAQAEHFLERYAEPLAALVPGVEWPAEDLAEAWYLLHLNGAHDSVCGCSTDEVAAAVDRRTTEVTDLASQIVSLALGHLAVLVEQTGVLVFNPSPFERYGVPSLGWRVMEEFEPNPEQLTPEFRDGAVAFALDDSSIELSVEDLGDVGDLYTFCPEGDAEIAAVAPGDAARFSTARSEVTLSAWRVEGEDFIRLRADVDNHAPDHRLRLLVALPEAASGSLAGAPFEIVERPLTSEGGPTEPPSPCWPARGFVFAGGRGVLAEGVFEYEVTGAHLAITLMRCTGNISRGPMPTRSDAAGPDVETPGAQLLGSHSFDFGLSLAATGVEAVQLWECFALEPLVTAALGEGHLEATGTLLDLEVPALSSIRRIDGAVVTTIWNPAPEPRPARIGEQHTTIAPHRIERSRPSGSGV
ncbi:MAG: hypothetical protein GEU71_07490 [Actinobacteria bacterium]|nr:hypothetical protein [Actinomycetota bacterium]